MSTNPTDGATRLRAYDDRDRKFMVVKKVVQVVACFLIFLVYKFLLDR